MHTHTGHVLRRLSFVLGLGIAAPALSASPAAAQDDGTVEMARERFQEGVSYYDQREYEKARLAFLQAYALKPHPAVLLNLAQSELRADRPADAATHFAKYLRENTEASESERQEAELGFAAARSKVAEVDVNVDIEGATLSVDGEDVGKSPLPGPLYLTPGTHTIEARTASGKTATSQVSAGPGQSDSTTLTLAAPPPAAAGVPAPSPVDETGGEEFDVEVDSGDGRGAGGWISNHPFTTTSAALAVAAGGVGTAFALLAKRDFDSATSVKNQILGAQRNDSTGANTGKWPTRLNDEGEQELAPPCALSQEERNVIAGEDGLEDGAAQLGRYDTACATFASTKDDAEGKRTVAIIGFVGAGVFAAGAVGLYFLEESMREDETAERHTGPFDFSARIVPVATPTTQGLSIVGTF